MPGLMELLSYAGNAIDLPASSLRDLFAGSNPFDQWATPFSSDNRTSGRDMLNPIFGKNKETGMAGWLDDPMEGVADVLGFGAEMLLDPLNFVSGAGVMKALKGRKAASLDNVVGNQPLLAKIVAGTPIGRGGNAAVYDIPGTDYVLRKPHRLADVLADFQKVDDVLPGMSVGQAVASNSQGASILRKQYGTPAGLAIVRGKTTELDDYIASVRTAASMPQSAYDGFAGDLSQLAERGYQFDPSKSNNVLMDTTDGRFNLVDVGPSSSGHKSGLEDMLVPLMGNTYSWKYNRALTDGVTDQRLTASYRSILSKAEEAARRKGLSTKLNSSGEYSRSFAGIGSVDADAAALLEAQQLTGFTPLTNPMRPPSIPSLAAPAATSAVYNILARQNNYGGVM